MELVTMINKTASVDQDDKQKMEGHLTMEEITTYIKQLKNNKSPGSTGFTGNFYNFCLQQH